MGMGFAPTWLRRVSPPPHLLHKTTLTTAVRLFNQSRTTDLKIVCDSVYLLTRYFGGLRNVQPAPEPLDDQIRQSARSRNRPWSITGAGWTLRKPQNI